MTSTHYPGGASSSPPPTSDADGAAAERRAANVARAISAQLDDGSGGGKCQNDPAKTLAGVRVPAWLSKDTPQRAFLEASVLILLLLMLAAEVLGVLDGGPTISGITRIYNAKSGGLLGLVLIAIWAHIFIPMPSFWTSTTEIAAYNCA